MGNTLSIPILLVAAIFQATFVPQIRLLGGGPDLVFLIVLSWSINTRLEDGLIWAFVGGALVDLLSAAPTGSSLLGLLFVIFLVAGLGQQVYRIGFLLLGGLAIIGTIFTQGSLLFAVALAGFRVEWNTAISYIILPTLIYNLILIWPIYWIVRRIQRAIGQPGRTLAS